MNTAGIAYDAHGHEIVVGSRPDRHEDSRKFKDVLQTYTGKVLKPMDPQPGDFQVEDIAWSLAMQCRYNGHTKLFYSVAAHCILVAWACPVGFKRAGLLHDASEAYLSDLPTPVKARMPEYQRFEALIEEAIAKEFGLAHPLPPEVKAADDRIFQLECALVMGGEIERRYALAECPDRTTVEKFIRRAASLGPEWVADTYMQTYHLYNRGEL